MQAFGQTNDQLLATDADAHHLYDSLQKNVTLTKMQKNENVMLRGRDDV